jgi:hypothetical protein
MFSNYARYIFHDSCGFEAGSDNEELRIVQEFIQQRAGQTRPQDRLHAIWFALSNLDHYNDGRWLYLTGIASQWTTHIRSWI